MAAREQERLERAAAGDCFWSVDDWTLNLCLKVLTCVTKVTKMNCSFFFLFKLGFTFVNKKAGIETLRTKIPRHICWLPPGMTDLGMADCKSCPQTPSAATQAAVLRGAARLRCPRVPLAAPPSPPAGRLSAQVSPPRGPGGPGCPCPLQGPGHLPASRRRGLCWSRAPQTGRELVGLAGRIDRCR